MCGHTGFVRRPGSAGLDASCLARMNASLVHRGPDDEGVLLRGPIGMGFRRLSIIDIQGGQQPIESEDGLLAVVGNGEIYNHRALRADLESRGAVFRTSSDIETILHLYREKGRALVDDLVGMYAFCIADWRDEAEPKILLGRDCLGIKPLYWADTPAGFLWGSEPKALLASEAVPREARPEALLDYLVQGYVGGPQSAWGGIQRLLPGHTLSWSESQGVELRRFWDLPTDGLRDAATHEEVLAALDASVADRLESEVPLGGFLSGGVDSSAVVDSMARSLGRAPIVCSVGFEERSHNELDTARATAASLGAVQHAEILKADPTLATQTLPWFFDEPHADPSTVPTYLVSKMAREHVTVALSGDGGDETFAGYRRYVHDLAENRVRARLGRGGRALAGALGHAYPKLDWAPRPLRAKTFLSHLGGEPGRAYWNSVSQASREEALALLHPDLVHALRDHDPFHAFEEHYRRPTVDCPLYRAQYADFHTNLPDRILAKVDRASMAVSLEVRVPLLDHRFVGRFANLPAQEKVFGGRGKHRLREALRSRLSPGVLDGVKRGFDTPLASWLRGPLAGPLDQALRALPEDWFVPGALQRLAEEHQSGRRDHARLLWSLLVLEHWRQRHGVKRLAA
ncbi:MAG: asparagine synthase (glutamine-hydrolyzing) [bacterium]